jgi:CBS domain containing-hemolysin-like protein
VLSGGGISPALAIRVIALLLGIEMKDLPSNVTALSGLLQLRLDRIPKRGERVSFPEFEVVVRKMGGPRVLLVKLLLKSPKQLGARAA